MYSLDNAFNELLDKIRDPGALDPAKSDPVFYFVYPPELMLDLKKRLPRWVSRIREAGFEVRRVSIADVMWKLVDHSGRWDEWLKLEGDADIEMLKDALSDVLRQNNALLNSIAGAVESASGKVVVLITEIELLHPFTRTKIIGDYLHDKAQVPTVFLYPGTLSGQSSLKFLGFHSVDPGYRAAILGGL
ncbi:BREX protein BrxB domain-containing protein [Aminirod propionatiphilus]|uniref:DUF1788 domain-containing protein n=1 Tax=Aminirod propionatiphilus TaxID=3415223 RepID=A0ACD1DU21_9BACT|nr:DUF1788 domain-containing protein [Synergistota bacterium]